MTENYHTHTKRCRHATGTEREYIETAISRGVKILGFSDHCPQIFPGDFYSNFRMLPEETDEYFRTLSALREEYHKDIGIKIGFEVEYYPELFEKLLRHIAPYDLDYLILGQHYIDNEYDNRKGATVASYEEEELDKYVTQTLEALETGIFSYLAHPDVFRFEGDDDIFSRQYRRLCEGAKALGIPLEFNLLGLSLGRFYPSEKFFKIAAKVGNEVILGSDAHEPDRVCHPKEIKNAKEILNRLGITPIEKLKLKKIE